MRKLVTLFFAAMAVCAGAREITPEVAAEIASDFLNTSTLSRSVEKRVGATRVKAKSVSTKDASQPFYVFNAADDRGFVIISGDDRARKILGYSDQGSFDFDNLPPQLAAMLDQYAKQIESLPGTATTDPSWSKASRAATDNDGILLETANWGQGYPYNLQCPEVNGQRCVTGCVATAMAIVMKYHNWPDRSVGSNVYWNNTKWDYEEMDYSNLVFDWASMTNSYDEQSSQTSNNAVAILMNAAGHAVDMSYSPFESGAMACYTGHALRTHFKYAESCEFIHKSRYTNDEWVGILRDELDSGRPVIYQGSGIGNHEFVCDGYSNDGLFHINWGWDGAVNGYYSLSALNPNGYDFSQDYAMIKGIEPDKTGREYSDAYVDGGYISEYYGNSTGANMSVENIIKDEPFFFSCRTLTMPSGFSGEYGVAIVDKNGNLKSVLASTQHVGRRDIRSVCEIEYANIVCEDIEPESSDMIQVVTKRVNDKRWLPVRGTSEAPAKLKAKGHNVEKAEVELISNTDASRFQCLGELLQTGIHKLPVGAKLGYWFAQEAEDYKEGYLYNSIVNYNGKIEVKNAVWENSGAERVIQKGKYTISLIMGEALKETITLGEPGSIANVIVPQKASTVTELKLGGLINYKDLEYIRSVFVNMKRLDLTKSTIVEYQGDDNIYPENTLPAYSLAGLKSLEYVFLPENIESIEGYALASCNLLAIELPASVKHIGSAAFYENPQLNSVMVHWDEPIVVSSDAFYSTACPENGTLYVPIGTKEAYATTDLWAQFSRIEEKEIFDIVTIDYILDGIKYKLMPGSHSASIVGFTSSIPADVVIPENITYDNIIYTVTAIKSNSFYYCRAIHSLVMPNTINEIGVRAFMLCENMKSITISNSIKYIPVSCFCYCYALEVADIPDSVQFIEWGAFDMAKSLKKLHLPAMAELSQNGAFYGLSGCESITVDSRNPYYIAEDNMLYSKDKKSLILIAGTKKGQVIIPEAVEKIPWHMFYFMPYITDIMLPSNYAGDIPYQFVSNCPMLKHVSLPDASKKTNTETITYCDNLESITIGRNLEYGAGVKGNPKLKHVFLRNNSKLDLLQMFADGLYKNMNFYTDRIEPNALLDKCEFFYVPGSCKEKFDDIAECIISEMWKYQIDRKSGRIAIIPAIDCITIDKICINGTEAFAIDRCLYSMGSSQDLDITVDFTLMGRQAMTTHYDVAFNASLPDTDLSKVSEIILNESELSLYVGQSIKLSATVSPEFAVNKTVEWTSNAPEIATVDQDGNVTALSAGSATIVVKSTYGSEIPASCNVSVYLPEKGDSNANGTINIADAVNTANYAVGNEVERFCVVAADVNADEEVTVADASGTITIILAQSVVENQMRTRSISDDADYLTVQDYSASIGETISIDVCLDNSTDYVALQADFVLPKGLTLQSVTVGERGAGHSITSRQVGDRRVRVALFDLRNSPFAHNNEAIIRLYVEVEDVNAGDITVENIIASDGVAHEYILTSTGGHNTGMTGIDKVSSTNVRVNVENAEIKIYDAVNETVVIYGVDGHLLTRFTAKAEVESYSTAPGVYIVKVGNRMVKTVVK